MRAPFGDVLSHLSEWRRSAGNELAERQVTFNDVVKALESFEAPWTQGALFDCDEWTAYMNNSRYGGDPSSAAPYLATSLRIECFTATHAPPYGPGDTESS